MSHAFTKAKVSIECNFRVGIGERNYPDIGVRDRHRVHININS